MLTYGKQILDIKGNKMIKKMIKTTVILSTIALVSCSKVPAGYRGVIVNLYGSDKGVSEQSVGVGRYYLGWNSEL